MAKKLPENFKGVKGKSGRKPVYEEHNKSRAINLLWEKIRKKVEAGEELSEYEQKFAMVALPKTIKTQTDITSGDKPIPIITLNQNEILSDNINEEDNSVEEED